MELRDYLRIAGRRKWIIIQSFAVVVVVALVASFMQKPVYEASTTLLVREKSLSSTLFGQILPELSGQAERTLQTQVDLIKLEPVAEAAVKSLGLSISADALLKKTEVEARPQSNLLIIKVRDGDPAMAQKIANQLATEYIKWNQGIVAQDVVAARDEVQSKLKETEDNLVKIAKKVGAAGGTAKISQELSAQWAMSTSLYTMLAEKYEQLRILSATSGGGSVLAAPAKLPQSPVSPRPMRNGILGGLVGLVLGLGSALLLEYVDNTFKAKEDVEEYLREPVLGVIPSYKAASSKLPYERVAVLDKASFAGEWFKVLRANLHYLNADREQKTFVITSPGPEEGKTTLTANLAAAYAAAGKKTRVMCCDLRRPVLHEAFHASRVHGLTNVLCDGAALASVMQLDPATGVEVIASGPIPPDPGELLASHRMTEVMKEAVQDVDVLLVDTPPVTGMSDTLELASKVDGVICAVYAGKTSRESARRTVEALKRVEANVLGVVLMGAKMSRAEGYYSYEVYSDKKGADKKGRGAKQRRGRERAPIVTPPIVSAPSDALIAVPSDEPAPKEGISA